MINGMTLAGKQQHGFQKNKSTVTAGLLLQSLIAEAQDDDKYVALASLDLSTAFDIINVDLLLKSLWLLEIRHNMIIDYQVSPVVYKNSDTCQGLHPA